MSSIPDEVFTPYMPHGDATPASIIATLDGALARLGSDGAGWVKGQLRRYVAPGVFAYCVVGACESAAPDYESYDGARRAIADTIGGSVDRWNNRPETTIADVRAVLEEAKARLAG